MKIKSGDWRQHDKDYERERLKHPHPVPGRAYILKVLTEHSGPLTSDELAREIGLGPEDSLEAFAKRMQAMLREGQVVQNRRGAYGPARSMNVIKGTVSGHRDGFGWLIPADGGPDIFLNSRQMQQLLPGDLVFYRADLGHMGMYIGGGQYIHAPQTGDVVKISSMSTRDDYQGAVRPY